MSNNIAAYIEQVAVHYWGEPKERRGHELRWGNHGSKSVDLRKGTFFDFEANEGGGVIQMVKMHEGATLRSLPDTLERKFGIPKQTQEAITPAKYISKIYEYYTADGELAYEVVRYEPKTFRQRRPDGKGGYTWKMDGVEPVPYNLPSILSDTNKVVFVVEGEKCADRLTSIGALATTSHGGAGKWQPELNKYLKDRRVVIIEDNDEAGAKHAQQVSAHLVGIAKEVKRISLPGLPNKGDIVDWLNQGYQPEDLRELVNKAPVISTAPEIEPEPIEAKGDVFELYSIDYLRNMPPVEWTIDGVITKHGLSVLYGEPGAGKSFIAIDMALSIAYGVPWQSNPVQSGAVLYIAGEGVGGLGKRIKAWQAHHKLTHDVPFYVLPIAVRFREPDEVERLIRTIDGVGHSFSAVFVDTVARALLGGNENDATDMGLFVDACEAVKRHCGCALVAIHHSGKDAARGMRGSTALLGAVDTSVRISKLEDTVTMAMEKQKDAEPIADMAFEMTQIALIDDVSVVMTRKDAEQKKKQIRLTSEQHIALDALRNVCAEMGQNRVPVAVWHEAHRVKTPDFTSGKRRDARAGLQNKRVIVIEENKVWEYKELSENV